LTWRWITIRVLAVLTLLAVTAAGCSASRSLGLEDDGSRVALRSGDEIEITLAGNATTGFSWELVEFDPAVITALDEPVYEEVDTDLVGGGGEWIWTLAAQESGECEVRFVYHRTWEDEPPEETFSFIASVSQ
jgi:predicted secreted protein